MVDMGEELKSIEGLQPASRSCKEVADFVTANADPLIPTTKKIRRSCRFWKWLCGGVSCFNVSWICCCSCTPHLKMPRCSCCYCCDACHACTSCSNPCANCRLPKCDCFSCYNSKCCNNSKCGIKCCRCCIPKCPSCPTCSCTRCTCYPKCPNLNISSCCCKSCCCPC
ncbi:hypothetical protein CDL12_08580 [Handroanthus impetiginosus]|uniref:Uncharacterized protein n=1 Tax=Handroanthus impetiginosus TaxID=429701 RepID=A0A2G9HMI8_9LAMI|nr:hypothetical protein CDL12_08580 [Handroanthus impetiginosus]